MDTAPMINEAEILTRVIAPGSPTIPPDTAKILLTFDFGREDKERMDRLAQKAQEGTLSATEQAEIDCYERVGHFLSLLRAKARLSLQQAESHA